MSYLRLIPRELREELRKYGNRIHLRIETPNKLIDNFEYLLGHYKVQVYQGPLHIFTAIVNREALSDFLSGRIEEPRAYLECRCLPCAPTKRKLPWTKTRQDRSYFLKDTLSWLNLQPDRASCGLYLNRTVDDPSKIKQTIVYNMFYDSGRNRVYTASMDVAQDILDNLYSLNSEMEGLDWYYGKYLRGPW